MKRALFAILALKSTTTRAGEPNPPEWPDSVHIFGPETPGPEISNRVGFVLKCANDRICGHFSDERFAILFKPGHYRDVSVHVGYYVQVLGLGERADDTVFSGGKGVHCEAMDKRWHKDGFSAGSLDVFWRGAENFRSEVPEMMWAVSQAAPLRRVHATRNLVLHDKGRRASGGFFADMQVDGATMMGSQQQWFGRNCALNTPHHGMGGVWNMVFVGSSGAPPDRAPGDRDASCSYTNVPKTPVVAEKPFITIGAGDKFTLQVPPVKSNSQGASLNRAPKEIGMRSIPFEKVFVARSDRHNAPEIQRKLDAGLHVVLSPGIYNLQSSLTLKHRGQVLLGIGMATLMCPKNGQPCVKVLPHVPGVRVAGIMMGAAQTVRRGNVDSMLEWGSEGVEDRGDAKEPGVMTDIFARVGGPEMDRQTGTDIIVRVHSGHVIGDNLWLWRADHAKLGPEDPPEEVRKRGPPEGVEYHLVKEGEHPVASGLEVRGVDVTIYGLFVEHTLGDMTVWSGDHGRVYFYQSELPYDSCNPKASGYVVTNNVRHHQAVGVGVYTYFRDGECWISSSFRAPDTDGVVFKNAFSRFLNGKGGIEHVLNNKGAHIKAGSTMARLPSSGKQLPASSGEEGGQCFVGKEVQCPGSAAHCAGNQCCPDSTCPSAAKDFSGCPWPKKLDCTTAAATALV